MSRTVYITYFIHGTTTDNENGIATGWHHGKLSELGKEQSVQLRELTKDQKFDVVFSSDLKRSYDSAKLTFGDRYKIIRDKRLRECNYGDLNGYNSEKVNPLILSHIYDPFPNGESYMDVRKRISDFLNYLLERYPDKNIAIVSHKAPQLVLEVLLNKKTWKKVFEEDWRLKGPEGWKPGWNYTLNG